MCTSNPINFKELMDQKSPEKLNNTKSYNKAVFNLDQHNWENNVKE